MKITTQFRSCLVLGGLLAFSSVDAATTVDIEATRAFHMNSGNAPDPAPRILAGGWPDNPPWGLMRGLMAFDLSEIPQDAAGIASAAVSIFTRKTGFSVTNPEGTPGDMAIKDVGNQEVNPDFDIETATWGDLDPPAGETLDIEYSIDLESWSTIGNGATGTFEDTDVARTAEPAGYYRARRT